MTPFYDPLKSYEENFSKGPFGAFADGEVYRQKGEPTRDFLGEKVYLPFGIPAGPLLNGNYIDAAFAKGFDLAVYKTVRSRKYPCAQWPNVLAIHTGDKLTLEEAHKGLIGDQKYTQPIAITNSFGVPSFDPDFWQADMKKVIQNTKKGQLVIGSFQGTINKNSSAASYIQDFVDTAKLVKETGAKVLEVNLSCPNEGTSHLLCFDKTRTRDVVIAIKEAIGETPLIIKIAYFTEQPELEKLVDLVGKYVQGIAAINTIPAKIIKRDGTQALPGEGRAISGVCGAPIKWAGIDMIKRLKKIRNEKNMQYKLIGVGGVTTPRDYAEFIQAGADAVMSATGSMWNPYLAREIKKDIVLL